MINTDKLTKLVLKDAEKNSAFPYAYAYGTLTAVLRALALELEYGTKKDAIELLDRELARFEKLDS